MYRISEQNRKRGIAKRFDGVRSIIVGKMEEASEFDRAKRVRIRTGLQEVARQVKTAKDKELANFMQYLEPQIRIVFVS